MQTVFRKNDLELRWSETFGKEKDKYLEIVCWSTDNQGDHTFTLASWTSLKASKSNGPSLHFIGNRPFEAHVDQDTFWLLAKQGQKIAEAMCELHS
jgi:hypothetical protein